MVPPLLASRSPRVQAAARRLSTGSGRKAIRGTACHPVPGPLLGPPSRPRSGAHLPRRARARPKAGNSPRDAPRPARRPRGRRRNRDPSAGDSAANRPRASRAGPVRTPLVLTIGSLRPTLAGSGQPSWPGVPVMPSSRPRAILPGSPPRPCRPAADAVGRRRVRFRRGPAPRPFNGPGRNPVRRSRRVHFPQCRHQGRHGGALPPVNRTLREGGPTKGRRSRWQSCTSR
jgi:hypothetical protein